MLWDWFLVGFYNFLGSVLLGLAIWNTATGRVELAVILVFLAPVQFTLAMHKALSIRRR